jgi:small nuclear ribonucleoprotein (snRNP)-like protein
MQKAVIWLAIFMLVVPVTPMSAGVEDSRTMAPSDSGPLASRLRDMTSEGARFFVGLSDSERSALHGVDSRQESEALADTDLARLRVRMQQLSTGTAITVVLRDGERVRGELANATQEEFDLAVPHPSGRKGVTFRRTFRYEEIASADIPEAKGWSAPEKIRELSLGKRVEMLLVDGSKVEGNLKSVTGRGVELESGKKGVRDYAFEEIASVRPSGMTTSTKIVIIAGVVGGILLALSAVVYYLGD